MPEKLKQNATFVKEKKEEDQFVFSYNPTAIISTKWELKNLADFSRKNWLFFF